MKHFCRIGRIGLLLVALLAAVAARAGQTVPYTHNAGINPDSAHFTTASLLTVTPTEVLYSSLGHSAIRLECPWHDLDFCFTLETDLEWSDFVRFFAGRGNAAVRVVPTDEFARDYQLEGRGIQQYELNLTVEQRKSLWQALDTDAAAEPHRKFNFIHDNCSSALLQFIEQALGSDSLHMVWPEPMQGTTNGYVVRHVARNAPWIRFWCMTLLGADAGGHWPRENLVSPELLPQALSQSTITGGDGVSRPAVLRQATMIKSAREPQFGFFTPMVAFGLLLAVVLAVTALEWLAGKRAWARWLDVVLLAVQTVAGLLLTYISFVSNLFTTSWNWYLIAFNPIPALLWLACRKRPWYHRLYWAYTAILVLLMLSTPLIEQLDVEHLPLIATLAVRTLSRALTSRRAPQG